MRYCREIGHNHLMIDALLTLLQDGLKITYFWIKEQIEKEKTAGVDVSSQYSKSTIVGTSAPVALGSLRKADGKEGF